MVGGAGQGEEELVCLLPNPKKIDFIFKIKLKKRKERKPPIFKNSASSCDLPLADEYARIE